MHFLSLALIKLLTHKRLQCTNAHLIASKFHSLVVHKKRSMADILKIRWIGASRNVNILMHEQSKHGKRSEKLWNFLNSTYEIEKRSSTISPWFQPDMK